MGIDVGKKEDDDAQEEEGRLYEASQPRIYSTYKQTIFSKEAIRQWLIPSQAWKKRIC